MITLFMAAMGLIAASAVALVVQATGETLATILIVGLLVGIAAGLLLER